MSNFKELILETPLKINNSPVVLDVFTDSASYARENGIFDSNVGYFIYFKDNLLFFDRKDYTNKTNNFGELRAIELALKYIKNTYNLFFTRINIYTDSQLSILCLTEYLEKWKKKSKDGVLYNSRGKAVKNQDIIFKIIKLRKYFEDNGIEIKLYFVRSHTPNYRINEFHKQYCIDNNISITLEEYELIRKRNLICDTYIKRENKNNENLN